MSNSKNGSLVGQIIKGAVSLVAILFTAKQGHNKWKDRNKGKNS
ncbi:hypothetical protein [Lacinutrix undariae]